jgi:hypothetical protein
MGESDEWACIVRRKKRGRLPKACVEDAQAAFSLLHKVPTGGVKSKVAITRSESPEK